MSKWDSVDYSRTRWSMIRRLAGKDGDGTSRGTWHAAWNRLAEVYRPAMERQVRRILRLRGGAVRPDEAEDVCQDFLLECLAKDHLIKADPEIGRFRTFLAVCLRRYTTKYCAARHAKKRLPDRPLVALEEALDGPDDGGGADLDLLTEDWAHCLVASALPRVRERSANNADVLSMLLVDADLSTAELADRLGQDHKKVALRVFRAKRMLAEEIWAGVKDSVSSAREFELEREELLPYLSRYLNAEEAPSLWREEPSS